MILMKLKHILDQFYWTKLFMTLVMALFMFTGAQNDDEGSGNPVSSPTDTDSAFDF